MTDVIPRRGRFPYSRPVLLIDDLRQEHELIERVAGSLLAFVRGPIPADEARQYTTFFATYAGDWHHEREEEVLLPALTEQLRLPEGRGPVAVLLEDHRRMGDLLRTMRTAVADDESFDRAAYLQAAVSYAESLLTHIDMENSVFFPESESRLRSGGIHQLPSREMTAAETDAAALGERLIRRYRPVESPDQIRGEGCVMCPSYCVSCMGIEREWWNDWEWEEVHEHIAAS